MSKLQLSILTVVVLSLCNIARADEDCSIKTISWEVDNCSVMNKDATEAVLNKEYSATKKRIEEEYKSDSSIVKFQRHRHRHRHCHLPLIQPANLAAFI